MPFNENYTLQIFSERVQKIERERERELGEKEREKA